MTLILLRAAQGWRLGGELGVAGVLILEKDAKRLAAAIARRPASSTGTLALGLGFGLDLSALSRTLTGIEPAIRISYVDLLMWASIRVNGTPTHDADKVLATALG